MRSVEGGSKNGYVLSGWAKTDTTLVRDSRAFKAMAKCETEDADGQDITYRFTNNLNTYTQGWNYFCLILPAQKWDTTDLTICFHGYIGDLYIDGLQLTGNDVQTKSYGTDGAVTSSYAALKSDAYTYHRYGNITSNLVGV